MVKSREIFLLFTVVVMVVAIQAQGDCPKNQEFTSCGSACPSKCNDDDSLKLCTAQCVIGCQCKPGFVLNNQNECVTPAEC